MLLRCIRNNLLCCFENIWKGAGRCSGEGGLDEEGAKGKSEGDVAVRVGWDWEVHLGSGDWVSGLDRVRKGLEGGQGRGCEASSDLDLVIMDGDPIVREFMK